MAGTKHLELYQGDDYPLRLEFENLDGSSQDVSGFTYRAQIRRAATSPGAPLATFDVDLAQAASGVVELLLPSDQTAGLPARCVWDLEETDDNGIVTTLMAGAVTVEREVTR